LAICCAKLDVNFVLAAPAGYGFDEPFLELYSRRLPMGKLVQSAKPDQAVRSADIIYTDVWTSMGQESERASRLSLFADYQVNTRLLSLAPAQARIMHCLPAHRGEEVTSEVLDGERSIVLQQAANRLHTQKALLEWLLIA
jgi:ornithine carbamoyltransferase